MQFNFFLLSAFVLCGPQISWGLCHSLVLIVFQLFFFVDETRFELVTTMLQTAALPLELFVHLFDMNID